MKHSQIVIFKTYYVKNFIWTKLRTLVYNKYVELTRMRSSQIRNKKIVLIFENHRQPPVYLKGYKTICQSEIRKK